VRLAAKPGRIGDRDLRCCPLAAPCRLNDENSRGNVNVRGDSSARYREILKRLDAGAPLDEAYAPSVGAARWIVQGCSYRKRKLLPMPSGGVVISRALSYLMCSEAQYVWPIASLLSKLSPPE